MNIAAKFEHQERVFSYRFFGDKTRTRLGFKIRGLHFNAFTPTALKISRKGPRRGMNRLQKLAPNTTKPYVFEEEFDVSCPDKLVLKALDKSKPLQDLIRGIFSDNIKFIEIREEVMIVEFSNPVPGRISGNPPQVRAENPADNVWARDLKIKLLKLSQVVAGATALSQNIKERPEDAGPGLVMAAFFAVASAFVATAFYVQEVWFH